MCGICGIVGGLTGIGCAQSAVDRMSEGLIHRGPDQAGRYADGNVALGVRRLNIIDLAGGSQPLYSEDRQLVLVANAEIYNFIELRRDLQAKGHVFLTRGDCETILHLYEENGTDCVDCLRGMFAFALWDIRRRRLMLARDRMGEKPLYFHEVADGLVFASEMKALLRSGMVPFELDATQLDLYFRYGYVPEPGTPLQGVRKLPRASILLYDAEESKIEQRSYWSMLNNSPIEADPPQRIREELERISELVIRSDVPVGVALSGGLDSSAIAAMAANKRKGEIHAFTVGYPGLPSCDERPDARAFAEYLGLPFHEVEVESEQVVSMFEELNYWRDDPIADIAGHGYYAVMQAARLAGVPVMLLGQGGDELFWGYPWVRQAAQESRLKHRRQEVGWLAFPEYLGVAWPESLEPWRIRKWLESGCGIPLALGMFERHRTGPKDRLVFSEMEPAYQEFERYLRHSDFRGEALLEARQVEPPSCSVAAQKDLIDLQIMQCICDTYLVENGVAQADRLGMASSVEVRLPFLDYRLVEILVGLRKTLSDTRLAPKAWLQKALQGFVPRWVAIRPKRGFTPPFEEWHRAISKCHGTKLVDGFLVSKNILDASAVRKMATVEHAAQEQSLAVFRALVLELWFRQMSVLGGNAEGGTVR